MEYRVKELPTEQVVKDLAERYPEVDVSALMTVTRLLGTAGELEKCLEVYLAPYGVSLSRFYVLMMLRRYMPEGLKPTEIAEKIATTRGNITGLLDGLERNALVTREDSTTDRRVTFIKLSKEGQKLLDRMLPGHLRRLSSVMTKMTQSELLKMTTNLEKIRESLIALNATNSS